MTFAKILHRGQILTQRGHDLLIAGNHGADDIALQRVAVGADLQDIRNRVDDIRGDMQDIRQRTIDHLNDAEEHQKVNQHRQAARRGGVTILLLQPHQLFLLTLLILGIFFLDLLDHRLIGRHPGSRFLLFDPQREHEHPQQDGE